MADNVYSHRNGETEPPTEEGRYWFDGKLDGNPYRGMAIAETLWPGMSIWSDTMLGWDRISGETFDGLWWGPVTPPWEQEDG